MSQHPDRVSDGEFERRRVLLSRAMKTRGLDAVLIFGTFQGWQNVFYFSNHWDLVSCFLVIPAAGDPVLITGVYPHLSSIRDVSVIRDVRFGGGNSVELIASVLKDRNITHGKIGIVEPDSFRIPGIPHREMTALREKLPEAELVFCTDMVEALRRDKSDEEIGIVRECAELSDRCLERVIEGLRPGMSELDIAHDIEASPGATIAALVGSTSMRSPSVPAPSIRPTARVVGEGDVILIELSKGFAGYAGQVHGMISLGHATDEYLQMHGIALDAYRSIASVLRGGCRPQQVADAASVISNAGFTVANPLVHGFGMGIESGLHVGMPSQGPYWPPANFVFPSRSTVTIEPNPCDKDWKKGATAGGLVLVTETGCEHLQRCADCELIQKRI